MGAGSPESGTNGSSWLRHEKRKDSPSCTTDYSQHQLRGSIFFSERQRPARQTADSCFRTALQLLVSRKQLALLMERRFSAEVPMRTAGSKRTSKGHLAELGQALTLVDKASRTFNPEAQPSFPGLPCRWGVFLNSVSSGEVQKRMEEPRGSRQTIAPKSTASSRNKQPV